MINIPILDKDFIPFEGFIRNFLKTANEPIAIAIERNDGLVSVYHTYIHGNDDMFIADMRYVERVVKFLLWAKGGYKVIICGKKKIAESISYLYKKDGQRDFDFHFMSKVYEKQFIVEHRKYEDTPKQKDKPQNIGKHLDGCRIGFDAGGSDRKVSAVIDGESVYSEEIVWFPKQESDPNYHYNGILESFKTAASKMPRVDAIGVSSAGIYVENRTMAASLFLKVTENDFNNSVKDIYIKAASQIGDVPLVVVNDGDVTALAGSMSLNDNKILGIAMGTSEAVGYVDGDGNITGWLNELAFAPVDLCETALQDEWSLDFGVGCKYFSQDAVIKLATIAGISLQKRLSLAEKLKFVQDLVENDDVRAINIFKSIGCYLGHAVPLYARFYDIKHILLMGRVTSGKGGEILLEEAKMTIREDYPDIDSINIQLPSEASRRVGQSIAAASLPQLLCM